MAEEKMGIDTEVQGNDQDVEGSDEEAEGIDEEVEGNDEAVQGCDEVESFTDGWAHEAVKDAEEVESVTDGWAQEEHLLLPVSSPRDQVAKVCAQTYHQVICHEHSLLTGHTLFNLAL